MLFWLQLNLLASLTWRHLKKLLLESFWFLCKTRLSVAQAKVVPYSFLVVWEGPLIHCNVYFISCTRFPYNDNFGSLKPKLLQVMPGQASCKHAFHWQPCSHTSSCLLLPICFIYAVEVFLFCRQKQILILFFILFLLACFLLITYLIQLSNALIFAFS